MGKSEAIFKFKKAVCVVGEGKRNPGKRTCFLPFLGWAREEATLEWVGRELVSVQHAWPSWGLALVGTRGEGEGSHHGAPQVKELSTHSTICPLLGPGPGIGPLGQHPSNEMDLCLILL